MSELRLLSAAVLLGGLLTVGIPTVYAPSTPPPQQLTVRMAPEPAPAEAEPIIIEEPPAEVVAPAPAAEAPAAPRRLMLIGDSMAFTAAEGLAPHAAASGFTVINEGIFGCGVVRGGPYRYFGAVHQADARCEAWPLAWQAALDRNRPDMTAIVVGRWELMDRVHDGRWTNLFDPTFAQYVETEIERAIDIAGSTGARVVVFTTPVYRRGFDPAGGLWPEDDPARVTAVNSLLRRVAERKGAAWVDVGGWLSPAGLYTPEINGIKVRSDGVHLTRDSGSVLAPWLFPQLATIATT